LFSVSFDIGVTALKHHFKFIAGSGPRPRRRWLRDAVALPPVSRGER
jgi:hypothetical protein